MLKIGSTDGETLPRGIVLLLFSQGFLTVGQGAFAVLYNLYLAAVGQSLAFIGAFNALSILALGVSAVPIGAAGGRVSHRQALSVGVLLLVAVQVALVVTDSPALLFGAGIVWGIAQALCAVPAWPLISESVALNQRAAVFGRLYASWALATVVGSVLGGILPNALASIATIGGAHSASAYRDALLIINVITLFGWPPLVMLPATPERDTAGNPQADVQTGRGWALRSVPRTATAIAITVGFYSLACGLVAPFFNLYFSQELHISTALIGVLFALAALLSVPGSLFGPRLSRRLGNVPSVGLTRLLIVPCLLALTTGGHVVLLAMAGFLGRYVLIFMAGALDSHFSMAAVPASARPFIAGVRTGAFNLCWAAGAWGAGQLIGRTGYIVIFLASAAITAVGAVLFLVLFGDVGQP